MFSVKLKFFFFFILITFSIGSANAQNWMNQNTISNASPNVMSFGTFNDFPAILPTGVPNINVSVYELNYGGIKIPINLRYNVNLVKPDIRPGWVGLGWNLEVGGQITRIPRDKPDDLHTNNFHVSFITGENNIGYWYNHAFFSGNDWSSEQKIKSAIDDYLQYPDFSKAYPIGRSVKDYQPDEFTFSFLGVSGSCYLDENRNWKVSSNQKLDVKVEDVDVDSELGFKKFTITDMNGIKFVFGGESNSIEYNKTLFFWNKQPSVAKTWYLTKIILTNGEEIEFTYSKGPSTISVIPNFFSNQGYSPNFPHGGMLYTGSIITPCYLDFITTPTSSIQFQTSKSIQLGYNPDKFDYMRYRFSDYIMEPFRGQSIYYPYAFLNSVFIPDENNNEISISGISERRLDKIIVKEGVYMRDLKQINLIYSNLENERLKLSKVEEINLAKLIPESTYKFVYNNSKMLPEYLSEKTDHWGYYNGKSPDFSSKANFVVSRESDTSFVKAEILTKIIYPTGGYSVYDYEGHDYSAETNRDRTAPLLKYDNNKLAGGLRIRKITNYDLLNQLSNIKEYKYVKNYSNNAINLLSSGILGGQSAYDLNSQLGSTTVDAALMQSYLPLSNNNSGGHIAYSEVVELFSEGYQINHYSNFDNGINGEYMDLQPVTKLNSTFGVDFSFSSKSFERGVLLKQETFNKNGILIRSNQHKYYRNDISSGFVKNIYGTYTQPTGQPKTYWGSAFKTFTYSYLPTGQVNTIYDIRGENPVTSVRAYDYYPQTKSIRADSSLNSKGQVVKTEYLYPPNMVALGRDPNNIYSEMVSKNIISPVIEKKEFVNNQQIFLSRTNYDKFNSNNLLLPKSTEAQKGNYPAETKQLFTRYDLKGNLVEQKFPDGGTEVSLYGYQSQYPIAKIANVNYSIIESVLGGANSVKDFLDLPNPTDSQIQTFLLPLRTNSVIPKHTAVTKYTYKPLVGITSITDTKGMIVRYDYDSMGRILHVKDADDNIVKTYDYNYQHALISYGNVEKGKVFTRNNCTGDQFGGTVYYLVPAGKYTSTVSPVEANAMADADISANGQNYANANGTCTIPNPVFTCHIYNQSSSLIDFMLIVNGNNITGPRTISGNSENIVSGAAQPASNATVIVSLLAPGVIPNSAKIQGFWGSINGVIDASKRSIVFSGANLSSAQSFDLRFY